jgi:hypothetical protein
MRPGDVVETMTPASDAHPMASAYEAAECVRLRLRDAREPDLALVSRAVAEASYYLSDTMDPDDRVGILARAESRLARASRLDGTALLGALEVLRGACEELKRLLRGRHASAELRIALQALSRAEGDLAFHVEQTTASSRVATSDGHALDSRRKSPAPNTGRA